MLALFLLLVLITVCLALFGIRIAKDDLLSATFLLMASILFGGALLGRAADMPSSAPKGFPTAKFKSVEWVNVKVVSSSPTVVRFVDLPVALNNRAVLYEVAAAAFDFESWEKVRSADTVSVRLVSAAEGFKRIEAAR